MWTDKESSIGMAIAHHSARRLGRLLTALAIATAPLLAAGVAHAAEQPVRLSIKPVGAPGAYFDVTLEPGRTRQLTVELGNHGSKAVQARTYAAEAYTIINGGFGGRLAGETSAGTSTWVAYPSGLISLPAGGGVRRSFALTVPRGTRPGEYIAGLVVENATPVKGAGAVALDQVVRTVIAVAVRVPGPLRGGLAIGAAYHQAVGTISVVGVKVSNTGNRLLKPSASFVIKDDEGTAVTTSSVQMDSFYAETATAVELPLAELLQPGDYTVSLTLTDAERGASAQALGLPLRVEAPAAAAKGASGIGGRLADVYQDDAGGLPLARIAAGLTVLLLVVGGVVAVGGGRGHAGAHAARRKRAAVLRVPRPLAPSLPPEPCPVQEQTLQIWLGEPAAVPVQVPAPRVEPPLSATPDVYAARNILPGW